MALLVVIEVRQRQGSERAGQMIAAFEVQPLGDIGATRTLRILPLLEYQAAHPGLATEVGGLHFPVPEGRLMMGPLDVQRRLASIKFNLIMAHARLC